MARHADRLVIFNGDDFGRSAAINAAIVRAHRKGVLTSASLMVAGGAFQEAVELARANPTLAVGLHLVVAGGRAVLPPAEIPHLVDAGGNFRGGPLRLGLRYARSRTAIQELAREMKAQFERFAAAGLPLSHVDGHLHMHLHPVVFNLLLPLAERYGASGIRLPRDDLGLALRYGRRGWATKVAWAAIFGALCRWCRRRLRGRRLAIADRVYGLMQTGRMEEEYVIRVLRRIKAPASELYFHPSLVWEGEPFGPNPGDLATLLSPALRQTIQSRGLRLGAYSALRKS
mgnify:CR=1 FL=1